MRYWRSLHRRSTWSILGAALILSACSSGPSQADYSNLQGTATATGQQLATAQAALQQAQAVQVLEGVRKVPPPPTGTPAPAGATPAALATSPATFAQPIGPFTMSMETVASAAPSTYGLIASQGCTDATIFKRGMKMVWRFQIFDMQNGKQISDHDQATVKILLPNGQSMPAVFAPRGGGPGIKVPPDAPWTWAAAWSIPPDFPLGPLNYSVSVTTKDGRTATLKPNFVGTEPRLVD